MIRNDNTPYNLRIENWEQTISSFVHRWMDKNLLDEEIIVSMCMTDPEKCLPGVPFPSDTKRTFSNWSILIEYSLDNRKHLYNI